MREKSPARKVTTDGSVRSFIQTAMTTTTTPAARSEQTAIFEERDMAIGSIEWPAPPTPCDEGTVYHPILTCNGMGEWIPDFVPPEEIGGLAVEARTGATPCGGKCAPVAAILDAVRLGVEIYKQGLADGRSLKAVN